MPIVDSIIFKYPTKKHTIESTITTSGASSNKIKYTIANDKLTTENINKFYKITDNLKINLNSININAQCNSHINIKAKVLGSSNCYIDKTGKILEEFNKLNVEKQEKFDSIMNSMFKVFNNTDIMNKLKYDNISVKSGSILYKSIGGDIENILITLTNLNPDRKQKNKHFIKAWNEVKKEIINELEYEVIVKGWGLYNNKRVIVAQYQQEIDIKEFIYPMLKQLNKVKDKAEFNKIMGDKTIFSRLVGYELYDPNTFIKVYSHNISYTNVFNKITKRIETTKIKN